MILHCLKGEIHDDGKETQFSGFSFEDYGLNSGMMGNQRVVALCIQLQGWGTLGFKFPSE